MQTEGDELVKDAEKNQAAQDKATQEYVGAGTDQAEAFANDPKNASGSKLGASEDGRPGGIAGGLARVGSALQGAGKFAGANKKKIGVGGGIAGLLTSMVFGFFSLMPLKIESMMKNIYGDHMGRVENALERRAMRTFVKYAMKGSIASEGAIVATGSPLADLYKTWRTQNFEADLKSKYGYTIEKSPVKGKLIRVSYHGASSVDVTSEKELWLHYSDLNRAQARNEIKGMIKSETRWNQVIKRHHLRKWMFNAYGVRKWKIFDNKTGKDAETNLDSNLQEGAMGEYKTRAGRAIACLFGDASQCPDKNKPGATADTPVSEEGKAKAAELGDAIAEDAKTGTKSGMNERVSKIITNKALGKAIPIIGWVDLAARLDKFIWEGTIADIIIDVRKVQYAGVYADWLKISDQIKDGKVVSGDEVNAAMVKLYNSEKSNVSSRIYNNNPDAGEKVSRDDLFDTASIDQTTQTYKLTNWANHRIFEAYLNTIGAVFSWLGDLLSNLLASIPLLGDLIANIGNFIGEIVMKGFMAVIGPVLTGNETGAALMTAIDIGGDVTSNDFTQSVGGEPVSGVGLEQINRRIAADNLAEDRSKGLFYQLLSAENPRSATNRFIALMPSSPSSVITSGAHSMVATITSPLNTMGTFFNRIFAISTAPAYAAVTVDPYGIQQYGFTDEQLNRDIDEAGLQAAADWAIANRDPAIRRADDSINISLMVPTDCDLGSDTPVVPNLCKLDLVTLQSLKSLYTTEDDGGIGGTGTAVVNPPVGGAGGTGGVAPTGDIKALAIQMLANKNITYWTNNIGINTRDVVVALSEGKPAYTTCANAPKRTTPQLNPNILKFILEVAGQTNIMVNALTDKCHNSSTSPHYSGEAVDLEVGQSGPLSILNPIAAKYGGTKNNETNHHHYDFPK